MTSIQNTNSTAGSRWVKWSHQTARLLLRYPGIATMIRRAVRLFQGRYTAGVVGVVMNQHGEVLLVEHVFHPECPWGLPGGWLGWREAPAEAVERELREETGLKVKLVRPLLVERGYSKTHLDISYLCLTETELVSLCAELLDHRWVRPENLPSLLSFHRRSIAAAFEISAAEEYPL